MVSKILSVSCDLSSFLAALSLEEGGFSMGGAAPNEERERVKLMHVCQRIFSNNSLGCFAGH